MQTAKSVVITCAGIGSRLGLGTTKALIDINGKTLIHWQLDLFKDVDDIRIVVGFEANLVVEEVRKYRPDAIFVYNHDYFNTKTGTSYYLGARDGNEFALEYDGDLLVHPDDIKMLLAKEGEWVAYADKRSEDAVYLSLNEKGEVTGFSRQNGDYEWTGPCCLRRDRIKYSSSNVFNVLEPYIPLPGVKIRACDIDTYGDYQRAIEFIKGWEK
ncbi:NTP transferase domain-containing protein [Anaerovibrio lipolyticus]|uniref:NTP transferase domain-containing protein n=1 Tax=Anaerovibrio lipolyticus TaxID=82374 RepID=UPI000481EBA5|nr:NTP transferase domain-containing protein [Anaerovibrio lipolyticus]